MSYQVTMHATYPAEGQPSNVRAIWTGEKRFPKAGEWFLSGAIVAAYRTRNDLTTEFQIAKLVRVRRVEYWRIIGDYHGV